MRVRVYVNCKNRKALGFRGQGLVLRRCRENCENASGREKNTMVIGHPQPPARDGEIEKTRPVGEHSETTYIQTRASTRI